MGLEYRESDPVRLSDDRKHIIALDQTRLPGEEVFLEISKRQEMYDAIKTLAVRGAPCIGVFAGYCMAVLVGGYGLYNVRELVSKREEDAACIYS